MKRTAYSQVVCGPEGPDARKHRMERCLGVVLSRGQYVRTRDFSKTMAFR
jgi:hypothetical protein